MAEDDQDRSSEIEAEREAEIESEMERVGQNPDQVSAGSDNLGTQSAPSGSPRDEEPDHPDRAETSQEEAQELPDDQQDEQWAASGGDEELAEAAVDEADADVDDEGDETDADGDGDGDEDDVDADGDGDEGNVDADGEESPEWAETADEDLAEGLLNDDETD